MPDARSLTISKQANRRNLTALLPQLMQARQRVGNDHKSYCILGTQVPRYSCRAARTAVSAA